MNPPSKSPHGGQPCDEHEDCIILYPLFGARDDGLDRLQADLPDYEVSRCYDRTRGFVFIALRKEGDGPLLVMSEDAEEMRFLLKPKAALTE